MKRKPTLWPAALAVAFIVPLGITSASADVIMDWNAKADAIAAQKQLPAAPHSRGLAMMHVAMFEAVNAVERRYAPYKLNLPADRNSSKEAAAASAGYHVLVALYPDQKADLDAAFVAMLAGVAEGEPKAKGVEVGKKLRPGSLNCGETMAQTLRRTTGRTPARASMCRPSYLSFQLLALGRPGA